MADQIPARLTPAEGRRFGLVVGGAFLLFGFVSRWRGHAAAPAVLWGLGGVLVVLGLLVPGRLGPVYRAWMGLAHALSRVTTPIFMGLVYYLVLTPTGLVLRLLGRNPLGRREQDGGFWVARTEQPHPERMWHQF